MAHSFCAVFRVPAQLPPLLTMPRRTALRRRGRRGPPTAAPPPRSKRPTSAPTTAGPGPPPSLSPPDHPPPAATASGGRPRGYSGTRRRGARRVRRASSRRRVTSADRAGRGAHAAATVLVGRARRPYLRSAAVTALAVRWRQSRPCRVVAVTALAVAALAAVWWRQSRPWRMSTASCYRGALTAMARETGTSPPTRLSVRAAAQSVYPPPLARRLAGAALQRRRHAGTLYKFTAL